MVPEENYQPTDNDWQTSSHKVISGRSRQGRESSFQL